jgi:quinol monooxygenase YgiN
MASTLVIRHQIRDYDVWRSAFDRDAPDRREHGCTQEAVFRGVDDPTSILVAMDYPSRDAALGFLGNPVLKAAMESAGVVGEPVAVLGEGLTAQTV